MIITITAKMHVIVLDNLVDSQWRDDGAALLSLYHLHNVMMIIMASS